MQKIEYEEEQKEKEIKQETIFAHNYLLDSFLLALAIILGAVIGALVSPILKKFACGG